MFLSADVSPRQRLAAILVADVAGYSRLMSADEHSTMDALDAARQAFRAQIESRNGRVIDMAGDSVLAVFETATGAVRAALEVQVQLEALAAGLPADRRMRFRIGVHLGDVIEKPDGTVYGEDVNIAARLEGLALPGGVAVSAAIEGAVRHRVSAVFEDLGKQQVKNIADPIWAYRLIATTRTRTDAASSGLGNLPARRQGLIGREDELRRLQTLVLQHPLVTIVGAGGIGKTRLALAAAGALQTHWRDGAYLVEAATVGDPAQLPLAVAQSLRLALGPDQDPVPALQTRSLLLVLDNCEHLLDAASRLVVSILERAPGVHMLVTSQEGLRLPGEQLLRLQPLALPRPDDADPDLTLGALQLFAERARAADAGFALGPSDAVIVGEICRRLDGLPLAIELAAARVRLLGMQGLRDRLGDRLRLLTGGSRSALPRHQTLRAALEWSHALLRAHEQTVLRRLGVFIGGFTLELAQQVASDDSGTLDEWAVLDLLGSLVDKSLVVADPGEPVRYRLLESTRAFSLECLDRQGEAGLVRERHALAVCTLFATANKAYRGERHRLGTGALVRRLAPELANVRAALDWAMGEETAGATAITLALESASVFILCGLVTEALERMLALRSRVARACTAQEQVSFWLQLGGLAVRGGLPTDERLEIARQAVEHCRSWGTAQDLHTALEAQAWARMEAGDIAGAQALVPEMAAIEPGEINVHMLAERVNLEAAILAGLRREQEAYEALTELDAALLDAPGEDWALSITRVQLGGLLNCLGRHDEAVSLARELLSRSETPAVLTQATEVLVYGLAALGSASEALDLARDRWRVWPNIGEPDFDCLAMLAAARGLLPDAIRLGTLGLRRPVQGHHAITHKTQEHLQQLCQRAGIEPSEVARLRLDAATLGDAEAIALALRDTD
jgi:predicted ATPase/class 3 adenylate cyclase